MTLNRLFIILGISVLLAGVGIAWLWQYAYTPEGRARNILTEFRGQKTGLRAWMIEHGVISKKLPQLGPFLYHLRLEEAASKSLSQIGPAALPILQETLLDSDEDVREVAIRACGKINDSRVPGILARGMKDASPAVRGACAGAWTDFGGPEADKARCRGLEDPDPEVRISYLGGDDEAKLIEFLKKDKASSVRLWTVEMLSVMDNRQAKDALCACIGNRHEEESVLLSAIHAVKNLDAHEAMPGLLNLVKEPNTKIQFEAAEVLVSWGRREGVDFLLDLAQADKAGYYQTDAITALGQVKDRRVIPALRKLLSNPNADVRKAAADSLNTHVNDPATATSKS